MGTKWETFSVEFSGRGVWGGIGQRVTTTPIEVQAADEERAIQYARRKLEHGPIVIATINRITVRRLPKR